MRRSPKPGALTAAHCERAAQLVHHQGRQGFALNVLGNDQERLSELGNLFEKGKQVLHRADFLFVDEDAHVFEHAFHALGVRDEVGGEVAAVELHAFDHFERRFHRAGFLDSDDAVLADLLHGFGDDAADLAVVVGADRADLGDHVALDVTVQLLDFLDAGFHGAFDAALESRRACAGGHGLHAFAEDGLCQHGCGGGAVAGHVGSLGSDFAYHLRAHVFERILKLDFLCYRHAVLGDDRRAEFLFNHRVAALGAEGDLYRVCEGVDAPQNRLAGIFSSHDLLCHESFSSSSMNSNSNLRFEISNLRKSRLRPFSLNGLCERFDLAPIDRGKPFALRAQGKGKSYFLPPAALAAPCSLARISSSRRMR